MHVLRVNVRNFKKLIGRNRVLLSFWLLGIYSYISSKPPLKLQDGDSNGKVLSGALLASLVSAFVPSSSCTQL